MIPRGLEREHGRSDIDHRFGRAGWEGPARGALGIRRRGLRRCAPFGSSEHCGECQWAFYSIYGSSLNGPGILASYLREENESEAGGRRPVKHRKFDQLVSEQEIFSDFGETPVHYSWAAQDKICQAVNGTIRVAKYEPWNKERHHPASRLAAA